MAKILIKKNRLKRIWIFLLGVITGSTVIYLLQVFNII